MRRYRSAKTRGQSGVTLIEAVIALAVLALATGGLLAIAAVALTTTENGGHRVARVTEYAQDKVEQLIGLNYLNTNADTTVFPTDTAASATGTGLVAGGGNNPSASVNGYVDYLSAEGDFLGGGTVLPDGAFYIRVWQVQELVAGKLKQITVTCQTTSSAGGRGSLPTATLVILKANPF